MEIMNYKIYTGEIQDIVLTQHKIVNTINPHSFIIAQRDADFREALQQSDILLPDGYGIKWAAKVLLNKDIKRIAGYDIHNFLLTKLQEKGGRVFYLGSSEETLMKIKHRLEKEYPAILLETHSPSFSPNFTDRENEEIVNKINQFQPDVLFLGMTAPKQEKWAYQNKDLLQVKVICSVGAVFDYFAGTVKRPHSFWIDRGLEWLPRFLREPRRLWKRNLISNPLFVIYVLLHKFRINIKIKVDAERDETSSLESPNYPAGADL